MQSFGKLQVPESADLISVSSHKIHGPKGAGALFVRKGIHLPALIEGGGRSTVIAPARRMSRLLRGLERRRSFLQRIFIEVIRLHAEDGVDFVTLHCGITRKTIEQIRKHKRKMKHCFQRSSLVFAWMSMTGEENPFYEYYDEILDICEKYDVTISLGDACRPGCLADATDVCQIEELVRLAS